MITRLCISSCVCLSVWYCVFVCLNGTRWARIKVAPLGGVRQTARILLCLMSRFKRDRTALRHRFERCASHMVSPAWALNPCAWAAGATSLAPAKSCSVRKMSQLQRDLANWHFWGNLFQVPIRIIVLLAESRASNRVMTLGARTVPLSPGNAHNVVALQPNTVLRRRLDASRRQVFKDPVPDRHCLCLDASPRTICARVGRPQAVTLRVVSRQTKGRGKQNGKIQG